MILEMTQDANVVLPIMITSSFAYGIRKWLSPGSIYTLKLLRRGHIVPEGLQAAMSESMTVRDIMNKTYRMVEAETPLQPSEAPVLVREMHATGAKFALVTGTPGNPNPQEIIGIVSEQEVAASSMREATLK
ncbi:MAG TPA: hypothetical protein VKA69_04480 [Desulfobacteria bacterium]|nr:hypothetical protein [Desulfobacteria bacterium]